MVRALRALDSRTTAVWRGAPLAVATDSCMLPAALPTLYRDLLGLALATMTRPILTTLALLALSLSLPQLAAAEESMCGVRSTVATVDISELDAILTPAPAFPVFRAYSAAEAPAPSLAVDAEILWCASSDDPRCAPAHPGSGSTTPPTSSASASVLPASHPSVADSPIATLRETRERSAARSGFTRSLDRPPR